MEIFRRFARVVDGATTIVRKLLVSGLYAFELKVTDNNGIFGFDMVTVNVIVVVIHNPCMYLPSRYSYPAYAGRKIDRWRVYNSVTMMILR